MDVLGIETGADSWSVVHMSSSAFKVDVERFVSFKGSTFEDKMAGLKGYISAEGLKNVRIAIGLPRESSLSMVLDIPAPGVESIEGILAYELEKHIPLEPGEIHHGFQVLKRDQKLFSVLLATAKKGIVAPIVDNFTEAGLRPDYVTTWHASIFNALSYSNDIAPEKNIAFIGMNKKSCTLDIFSGLKPLYSKSFAIDGGADAGEANLGIIERELRRSILSLAGPIDKRRLDEGILISDNEPGEGFLQKISSDMVMPVRGPGLSEIGLPDRAAAALGAALSLLGKARMEINFAVPGTGKKRRRYLNNYILLAIVFFLALIAGSSYLLKDWVTMRGLERAMADVRVEKKSVQALSDRVSALNAEVNILEEIKGLSAPGPLAVLQDLSKLLPRDTWLTGFDFHGDSVSIEGYADRASALLMKMGKSTFMTDFEFAGPVSRTPDGKERFRMNFKLNASAYGKKAARAAK